MNEEQEKIIEKTARDLTAHLGFEPAIEIIRQEEGRYRCRLRLPTDQNFLIGKLGVNLAALQHLLRALVRRQISEPLHLSVDVNDYFQEREAQLAKEAEQACAEAERTGGPVTLRPMPAFERRVVHALLASHPTLETESTGEGAERRIIIRPKAALASTQP